MGWRIAGIIVALWAFNAGMHQPIFGVCIGLLAGWLFGRGRHIGTVLPRPEGAFPSDSSSVPHRGPQEPNAQREGTTPAAGLGATGSITADGPQPRVSGRALGEPQPADSGVGRHAPVRPATIAPALRQGGPTIGTRTSGAVPGVELADPFAGKEKQWSRAEQLGLLDLYGQRKSVFVIAQTMRIDQKQVAIKLIRLLLAPSGDMENADECPRNGKQYTKAELRIMEALHGNGMRLRTIANEVQRTQLGVGWRLLDLHMPQVPASLRGDLRSDG